MQGNSMGEISIQHLWWAMYEIKQTYSEQFITARKVIWKSFEQTKFISKPRSQTLLDDIGWTLGWSWLNMHVS